MEKFRFLDFFNLDFCHGFWIWFFEWFCGGTKKPCTGRRSRAAVIGKFSYGGPRTCDERVGTMNAFHTRNLLSREQCSERLVLWR